MWDGHAENALTEFRASQMNLICILVVRLILKMQKTL